MILPLLFECFSPCDFDLGHVGIVRLSEFFSPCDFDLGHAGIVGQWKYLVVLFNGFLKIQSL